MKTQEDKILTYSNQNKMYDGLPNEVIVFDLEATCEDREIQKDFPMEIIEIGAVKIRDNEVIDIFSEFVKPVRSKITPFCTKLTTITYEDLKDAPTLSEVLISFSKWSNNAPLISCGFYDRNQLNRELDHNKFTETELLNFYINLNRNHINIKSLFEDIVGFWPMEDMEGMLKELGLPLNGTHHRAIDDSINLANIYLELVRRYTHNKK